MADKIKIYTDTEIKKIIVHAHWGPYDDNDMNRMIKGARLVLDSLDVSESSEKATRDVDNWMGWLEKRIEMDSTERDYIEFALRQIRK